jgi:uncharacterized membrane protein
MRRSIDFIIEAIQFAGVAVALVGVVVAVVRAALASLAPARRKRLSDIALDLGRFVLMALDLMLVSAILEVAVSVRETSFTRLATVAALRVALTILLSFEVAYQADTNAAGGQARSRSGPRWEAALRRQFGVRPAGRSDDRPWTRSATHFRRRRADARPAMANEQPGENVWPDRARLGRD